MFIRVHPWLIIPPIWMRAMFFYLQCEETAAALDSSARVLKIVPNYDDDVFNYYDRFVPTVAEVLPYLADNGRASQAYFSHLLKTGTTENAAVAWMWLRDRSFSQDQLAVEYLDFLLRHRESGEAAKAWTLRMRPMEALPNAKACQDTSTQSDCSTGFMFSQSGRRCPVSSGDF
jgi:hypothetical protein